MQTEKYINFYFNLFYKCAPENPLLSEKVYSYNEKLSRETQLEKFLQKIKDKRKNNKDIKEYRNSPPKITFEDIKNLFRQIFNYEDSQLNVIFSNDFRQSTKKFIEKSQSFDPALSMEDIFQASRNVWIINGIQSMMGLPVELTSSIFAYSLLYPYTDNYLDNPDINAESKTSFSKRFKKRIEGESIKPENNNEKKIFSLIEIIENQYDRLKYPGIYESLLAIHNSQAKSIRLLNHSGSLDEKDVLKICIGKGGASVVADGYIISGSLTGPREKFLFGYGAYLQMADDIQDVLVDTEAGLLTPFSLASQKTRLDRITSRTFNFGAVVMNKINCFGEEKTALLKRLMEKSIGLLIITAVGLNNKFYSKTYSREIEKYSPFRFSYLKKRKDSFSPRIDLLTEVIKESILSGNQKES